MHSGLIRRETPPTVRSPNMHAHVLHKPRFFAVPRNYDRPKSLARTHLILLVDPAEIDPVLGMGVNTRYQSEMKTVELFVQLKFPRFCQVYRTGAATVVAKLVVKSHRLHDPLRTDDAATQKTRALPPSVTANPQVVQSFIQETPRNH
jgi:hypothetical protein